MFIVGANGLGGPKKGNTERLASAKFTSDDQTIGRASRVNVRTDPQASVVDFIGGYIKPPKLTIV